MLRLAAIPRGFPYCSTSFPAPRGPIFIGNFTFNILFLTWIFRLNQIENSASFSRPCWSGVGSFTRPLGSQRPYRSGDTAYSGLLSIEPDLLVSRTNWVATTVFFFYLDSLHWSLFLKYLAFAGCSRSNVGSTCGRSRSSVQQTGRDSYRSSDCQVEMSSS